jgi:uncharacterized repeat protein (TIGR03806 family)
MRTSWAAIAVLGGALASCSTSSPSPDRCTPGGDGTYTQELYEDLDRYCMVELRDGDVGTRSETVVAYDLVTPGFSDYAIKRRTIWVPPGTAATYHTDDVFEFPRGTIITKTFGFPYDPSQANGPIHWVETRILTRGDAAWTGAAYLWNDEQTAAHKQPGGAVRLFDVRATDGSVQHASYLVPSQQQCPKCHGSDMAVVPIGTRGTGLAADQLARWAAAGILTGLPAAPAPLPAAWDDRSATVDARARSYLAANCAFCHSAKGEARTSGLFLTFEETDPTRLGRCKAPVAAGTATGNLRFDLVPGQPDQSLLLQRMILTEPALAMPEIGRSVVHTEGVQLVREWIAAMTGDCSGK